MGHSFLARHGLKRVINASGRMSILGVSVLSDQVAAAMKAGGQQYVEMAELIHQSGQYVAKLLGVEDALIVNSASSGIALSVAALVTRGNRRLSMRLHQDRVEQNEIILFKGHNVQYGAPIETMIHLGGGRAIEVGYANEGRKEHIEEAVNERTAGLLYVQSHHAVQKNTISAADVYSIAQRCGVPLIVDAAAEEDLQAYARYADLVIYSGSKAIAGPTSGIVGGKRSYIEWVKVQMQGIGRSMKVGKEAIFGLLQALDEYEKKREQSELQKQSERQRMQLETLQASLKELPGVRVHIVQDEAGRQICRARIQLDPKQALLTAEQLAAQLREGDVAIYTRDYGAKQGYLDIDPRPLQGDEEMQLIAARIREILRGTD